MGKGTRQLPRPGSQAAFLPQDRPLHQKRPAMAAPSYCPLRHIMPWIVLFFIGNVHRKVHQGRGNRPCKSVASETKQAGGHSRQAASREMSVKLGMRRLTQPQSSRVHVNFSLAQALLGRLGRAQSAAAAVCPPCALRTPEPPRTGRHSAGEQQHVTDHPDRHRPRVMMPALLANRLVATSLECIAHPDRMAISMSHCISQGTGRHTANRASRVTRALSSAVR